MEEKELMTDGKRCWVGENGRDDRAVGEANVLFIKPSFKPADAALTYLKWAL
jgi:hypothetical protein